VILEPTVFVLGAGASQIYGFPLGPALVEDICRDLVENARISVLHECGPSGEHIENFRSDLSDSERSSIDAFIESRAADYDEVGRMAIAQCLLKAEHEGHLRPKGDWCRVLFDAILGDSCDQFLRNRLKVITFNFDRSFERKLFLALNANYPGPDLPALVNSVPVLHIHGDLGGPSWLPSTGWARPYTQALDAATIRKCAAGIHIVHHRIDDSVISTAQQWIRDAARVCFLGFSCHELNLPKLGAPDLLRGRECQGTAFRIDAAPLSRVTRLLDGTVRLHSADTDILGFLSGATFLYG
jgi:hypothetical protein